MADEAEHPETMGDRIAIALKGAGLTPRQASEMMGLERHRVTRWIADDAVPEEKLRQLAEMTGRPASWLRYGLVDEATYGIERYVTGYEDALGHVREALDKMQPPAKESLEEPLGRPGVRDAKSPARDREVERGTEPFGNRGEVPRKKPKRA